METHVEWIELKTIIFNFQFYGHLILTADFWWISFLFLLCFSQIDEVGFLLPSLIESFPLHNLHSFSHLLESGLQALTEVWYLNFGCFWSFIICFLFDNSGVGPACYLFSLLMFLHHLCFAGVKASKESATLMGLLAMRSPWTTQPNNSSATFLGCADFPVIS